MIAVAPVRRGLYKLAGGKLRTRVRLKIFDDDDEDKERRARGYTLQEWVSAPHTPRTRADCENGPRPCPCFRCRHHNGKTPAADTCSLDIADAGPHTQEQIAEVFGVSRQAVANIERDVTRGQKGKRVRRLLKRVMSTRET